MKRFVVDLTTGYCNLCDTVVVPSESVADVLAMGVFAFAFQTETQEMVLTEAMARRAGGGPRSANVP